jgi:anti-anti-sigma factor
MQVLLDKSNVYPDGYSLSFYRIDKYERLILCRIIGFLDSRNSNAIYEEVLQYISDGINRIILDLKELVYISSTGISILEILKKLVKPQNGDLYIINKNQLVGEIMTMYGYENSIKLNTELNDYLNAYDYKRESLSGIRFPLYIRCPVCGAASKIEKPMKFNCIECNSIIKVDIHGSILNEAKKNSTIEERNSEKVEYRIRICSENDLIELLARGESHYSHCISIGNPDQRIPEIFENSFVEILRLSFYDVDSVDDLVPGQIKKVPEIEDAAKVIDFYKRTSQIANGYEVHCWQGISRSTAVGLCLLKMMGCEDNKIGDLLLKLKPDALPHKKLVMYFDKLLGSKLTSIGEHIREIKFAKWKKELEGLK